MSFVRDALSWDSTGAIAYPSLHKKIVELCNAELWLSRSCFQSFRWLRVKQLLSLSKMAVSSAAISEVRKAAKFRWISLLTLLVTVTPYKKGLRERISRENIEDLYIPVIEDQLRRLARRMAYTIDNDCMTVIDAAAGNTSPSTGKSMGATGTEFTISRAAWQ